MNRSHRCLMRGNKYQHVDSDCGRSKSKKSWILIEKKSNLNAICLRVTMSAGETLRNMAEKECAPPEGM